PRSEVETYRAQGTGVVLDIDVKGARQVRQACPDAFSIFLETPSPEDYERRLRLRQTDDEASIARRLRTAEEELRHAHEYDHRVVNDKLEVAVKEVRDLISARF